MVVRTTGGEPPAPRARRRRRPTLLRMNALVRAVPAAAHVTRLREPPGRLAAARSRARPSWCALRPPRPEPARRAGARLAGRVAALIEGRHNLSIDDVRAIALPALRHRLVLTIDAERHGRLRDEIVAAALARRAAEPRRARRRRPAPLVDAAALRQLERLRSRRSTRSSPASAASARAAARPRARIRRLPPLRPGRRPAPHRLERLRAAARDRRQRSPRGPDVGLALLLDGSRSMGDGTARRCAPRPARSRRCSARSRCCAATRSTCTCSPTGTRGRVVRLDGPRQVSLLAHELERLPESLGTGLDAALAEYARARRAADRDRRAAQRRATCRPTSSSARSGRSRRAAARRLPRARRGADELETTLRGPVELRDAESGRLLETAINEEAAAEYAVRFARFADDVRERCSEHGVRYLQARSDEDPLDLLLAHAHRRAAAPRGLSCARDCTARAHQEPRGDRDAGRAQRERDERHAQRARAAGTPSSRRPRARSHLPRRDLGRASSARRGRPELRRIGHVDEHASRPAERRGQVERQPVAAGRSRGSEPCSGSAPVSRSTTWLLVPGGFERGGDPRTRRSARDRRGRPRAAGRHARASSRRARTRSAARARPSARRRSRARAPPSRRAPTAGRGPASTRRRGRVPYCHCASAGSRRRAAAAGHQVGLRAGLQPRDDVAGHAGSGLPASERTDRARCPGDHARSAVICTGFALSRVSLMKILRQVARVRESRRSCRRRLRDRPQQRRVDVRAERDRRDRDVVLRELGSSAV